MHETDKLIKKWSTLLNSTNNNTVAMLIEPMEMKIEMDRGNQSPYEPRKLVPPKLPVVRSNNSSPYDASGRPKSE
jgi:hypothetical protein